MITLELEQLTITLLKLMEEWKDRYESNDKPENKKDPDFFNYVKEETMKPFELIEEWGSKASQFVKNKEVSVHPQQIESTQDNLRLVLLHSYYIDARQRRYMNLHNSIKYVAEQLLKDIKKQKNGVSKN